MPVLTVSAGDIRTIRHASTAVYSESAAFQGYISTGRLVGLIAFDGIGDSTVGTRINSVTLRPTFSQTGLYGKGDRTVSLYASRYQQAQSGVTGADYLGRKLGDLTGNGKTATGTESTYAGAQEFVLSSENHAELFAAMADWLTAGNSCLALFNDETSLASGYNYSANYLSITACSMEIDYEVVHTVTFDANGVGTEPAAQSVVDGEGISLPDLEADGYRFCGWSADAGASDGMTGTYIPTGNVTLYAVWQKLHTVTFDGRGVGDTPKPVSVGDGESIPLPVLSAKGYQFLGWSADTAATSGMTGYYTPSEDVTLYAIWKRAGSYVRYNYGGEAVRCRVYCRVNGVAVLCRVYCKQNGTAVKI